MESRPDQPISNGVLDCLEYFEFASSPQEVISFYDQRRFAATTGEVEAVNKFYDVASALALYPQDCAIDPWPATELYTAFARSEDVSHVKQIVCLLPRLWEVDQTGAQRIIEMCLLRPAEEAQDEEVHALLEAVMHKSYLMGRMVVRSQTEDGIVLLSAERLRRRPQQAS